MFANGFPAEIRKDAAVALQFVLKRTYPNIKNGESENDCTYFLLDGQTISFPYRIYYLDEFETAPSSFTFEQKMIYHAVFTRSCDGFIREKHLKSILIEDYPDWILPYLVKLSDEYLVELLETTYQAIGAKSTEKFEAFCRLNLQAFLRSHDRMISYWNEYYRTGCAHYTDYVGRKLFSECFGYTKSMEKLRIKGANR